MSTYTWNKDFQFHEPPLLCKAVLEGTCGVGACEHSEPHDKGPACDIDNSVCKKCCTIPIKVPDTWNKPFLSKEEMTL